VAKLTKRTADALQPRVTGYIERDDDLKGFGLRVLPTGVKSWIIEYRPLDRNASKDPPKRLTLGRANVLTAEEARTMARDALQDVRKGGDPSKRRKAAQAMPMFRDFAETYLVEEAERKLKPRTVINYAIYLRKHAAPDLGAIKLDGVMPGDVLRLHRKIGKTKPVTANRVVETVSSLYRYAAAIGLVAKDANPAVGIEAFRERKKERFLSTVELSALGIALKDAETVGLPWTLRPDAKAKHRRKDADGKREIIAAHVTSAIRLLLFTGCRLREVLHLRWEHIDWERGLLLLPDSKTGAKSVILNAPALATLDALKTIRIGSFVIAGSSAGTKNEKPRSDIDRAWERIRVTAGLKDVRLHDLHHTHASFGAGGGLGLPIIGALLGHKSTTATARYAHLDADPLRRASGTIGAAIAAALDGSPANVVPLKREA
jgi:integrase